MPPKRRGTIKPEDFDVQWLAAETILERVKHSCYRTHILYKKRYLLSRERLVYYDVPIIVFSSVNSVFIAGARNFLPDDVVEITTCMLALCVGIIQALRTFFKVDENRENCLTTYKDLFRLFCEVSIILDQPRTTRGVDPQKFMADKNGEYKEIMNRAIVLEDKKSDRNPIYKDRHPWIVTDDMPSVPTPRHGLFRNTSQPVPETDDDNNVGLPIDTIPDSMFERSALDDVAIHERPAIPSDSS